jgi:tetratricopeptide (TPR) repeat protein
MILFAVGFVMATRPEVNGQSKDAQDQTKARHEDSSRREPPRDGEEWFARAYKFHNSDRYPEAIEAFKQAVDFGYRKATAMYNIACGYSLLNDKENAFAWLARAFENGFDGREYLHDDSDLDPLRSDPRFKTLLANFSVDKDREHARKASYAKLDRLEQANLDFARLERDNSQEGQEWAKVGLKLLLLRDLDRSIVALNRAVTLLDDHDSNAMYNLACAYALKGDRNAGIGWLEKAVNSGFDSTEKLRNDPDIASLRAHPNFSRIEKLSSTLSLSQFRRQTDVHNDPKKSDYSRPRWAPAIVLYDSFVKSEPSNGRAWFNLGWALHYSSEHMKAAEAFQQAVKLGYRKPTSSYNVACAYAMLNQKEEAFAWLERAMQAGFGSNGNLSWDPDLENLRSDPRFKRFLKNETYHTKVKTTN